MKLLTPIGGLLGAGLTLWLLTRFGFGHVLGLLRQAGWGILAVIAFHLVQVAFSAAAWRAIAGPASPRPSLLAFCGLRWIREAVNSLLPVGQVGGEFVVARLLRRRGMTLPRATACTICDLSTELVTQIAFTLAGLLALLALTGRSQVTDGVMGGIGIACLAAIGFVGGQWFGLAGLLERALTRLAGQFGWQGMGEIAGLQEAIIGLYRSPRGLGLALLNQSASWLLGTVEVCLALHFLGHDSGFAEGLVIESLGQAVRTAGFVVPGALGISEGGYVVVGALFGLPAPVSIALALVKRLREIALGLPALAAWQWLEHRWTTEAPRSQGIASAGGAARSEVIAAALEFGDAS